MIHEEKDVIRLFAQAMESGSAAALVTVISIEGSTPRNAGARMIVYADKTSAGTVGGGNLEALCIRDAVKAIREGASRKVIYDLKPAGIGMICMGKVEVFIDVQVRELGLLILGAGHVGEKVAEVAAAAGIPYDVADDRSEFANKERFPHASRIFVERPERAVHTAKPDHHTYIVIVTRGHALDKECLQASMKTKAAYIGMIGSKDKIAVTFKKLHPKGLHPEKDARVYSPVGLDIGGKSPGAIAVSIISEILQVHHRRSGKHMRGPSRA